ncbi:MAG: hypothetical protein E7393_04670 [Ruminococcaceae bacterium]|nr:hypothetical protein [Oscillospiraceae bacterium]
MTKEQKEKLSNRLVLNFGILLVAALVLLYVNSALHSGGRESAYWFILAVGIISVPLGVFLFIWGKLKKSAVKNYSAVCLGTLIACAVLYISKWGLFTLHSGRAVIAVYAAMAIYFIIMAIITAIQLHKPTVKSEAEKAAYAKKMAGKKKKRK